MDGGIRVSMIVRWPGEIEPGRVANGLFSLDDWVPTPMAAVGDVDIKQKLLECHIAGDKTFNVHLDGDNQLPYLTGEAEESAHREFFAWVDDGSLGAARVGPLKAHFWTRDHEGMEAWVLGEAPRKAPMIVDLRADPFEMAPEDASFCDDWSLRHMYVVYVVMPLVELVGEHMATFEDMPPRQASGSCTPKQ